VVFPQNEIGTDVSLVRDFAQTAEALGYSHLLIYDHVLGTHLAMNTMSAGLANARDHIKAIEQYAGVAAPFRTPAAVGSIDQVVKRVSGGGDQTAR
jgi:alkanesulfonate monooxygenase SsuD/methylene tetrahydromethanopterin reductase-like flavin-dependent oxidoreductase (luciferase family)